MKKSKLAPALMIFVGISGAFSVLFGAWLTHTGSSLSAESQLRLAVALKYQIIHTLALLATMIWYRISSDRVLLCAGVFFLLGMICFSFALYAKTYWSMIALGKLAPVGGIAMAIGWLLLAFAGKRSL